MAIILTEETPTPQRVPIIGLGPDQAQWVTQIPKAEIIFAAQAISITLAGVGDTQRFLITCNLPVGYAYAFMEGSVQMRETVAGDLANWDDLAISFITANTDLSSEWVYFKEIEKNAVGSHSGSTTLFQATYEYKHVGLKKMIVPKAGAVPGLSFETNNVSTNDAAMTSFYYFRFLQFDLNQGYFWAVNTPTVVR